MDIYSFDEFIFNNMDKIVIFMMIARFPDGCFFSIFALESVEAYH